VVDVGLDPHPAPGERPARDRRGAGGVGRVVALQVLVVVAVFAAAGAGCGWLWRRLWDSPSGVVSQGQWFTDETGLRDQFAGTGWYVAIAVVAGAVLGLLAAVVADRSEIATLVAVVVGSVLAGWLMLRVGVHLGPPDPDVLARTSPDGTRLPGDLRVPQWPPRLAFPLGAVLAVAITWFTTTGRRHRELDREFKEPLSAGRFDDGTAG